MLKCQQSRLAASWWVKAAPKPGVAAREQTYVLLEVVRIACPRLLRLNCLLLCLIVLEVSIHLADGLDVVLKLPACARRVSTTGGPCHAVVVATRCSELRMTAF